MKSSYYSRKKEGGVDVEGRKCMVDLTRNKRLMPRVPTLLSMRILGVDPGLTTAGLGLVLASKKHGPTAIEWLTIETKTGAETADRLAELAKDFDAYLSSATPDLAVVEKIFFATNKQTAIDVAQARGVILATLAEHGIPVIEITPLQLKSAIAGDGRADKKQVQSMVMRTLKLSTAPTPADAADALALALYGAFTHRV